MGGKLNLCYPAELEGPAEVSVSNICECAGCLPPPLLHAVVHLPRDTLKTYWWAGEKVCNGAPDIRIKLMLKFLNGPFSSARQQKSNSAITGLVGSSTFLLQGAFFPLIFFHGRIALKLTTVKIEGCRSGPFVCFCSCFLQSMWNIIKFPSMDPNKINFQTFLTFLWDCSFHYNRDHDCLWLLY